MTENARINTARKPPGHIQHMLYGCFLFFMPFTQALTFSVGFPLKFSELALILLSFHYILYGRKVSLPRPVIYLLSFLFVIVTLSVIINLFWDYAYPLRLFETRFGYKGDSISRYVYFILALLSFFISVDIFLADHVRYLRFWVYGALLAAAISWYLCIFSFLRLPVFLLPGMNIPPQIIWAFGRPIIRCGTFLEGNMMGLYLVLSAAICFYIKKRKAGIFLLASVISTFSTLSIACVFIFLFIYFQQYIFQRKTMIFAFPGLVLLIILFVLFSQTTIYKNYVYDKVFANTEKITDNSSYSKADRIFSIRDAFMMGVANPILGVGLANYALHYNNYMDRGNLDANFVKILSRENIRVIPNNIYMEIWSESGAIALILFLILMTLLLFYARSDHRRALFPAMLCMVLCFNAYPSFIMIYLWSFMALPVAEYIRRSREDSGKHIPTI